VSNGNGGSFLLANDFSNDGLVGDSADGPWTVNINTLLSTRRSMAGARLLRDPVSGNPEVDAGWVGNACAKQRTVSASCLATASRPSAFLFFFFSWR
jgi:hypothetical protein